ncbi:MAG: type II secretion system F family protein, partial [Candidatus Paceibacterota bacterium]
MVQYKYKASEQNGEIVENEIQAENVSEVLRHLTSNNLKPITIKKVGTGKGKNVDIFGDKINIDDQIFIFRYLSLMLKIGTNLLQAIDILIDDFDKSSVKRFLLEARSNLEKGKPFHVTFENHPDIFNVVHVNLIKAGQVSGNLENIFTNITDSLQKEKELKSQLKSSLTYPVLLFGLSLLILVFLVTFALPKIAGVFTDSGFEPPGFSKVVFSIGLFFGKIWPWLFAFGFISIGVIIYLYKTSIIFRKFIWSIISDTPVIKDIVQ